jgi:hypothetical protein
MTSIPCIDDCLVSVHDGASEELLLCPVFASRQPIVGLQVNVADIQRRKKYYGQERVE